MQRFRFLLGVLASAIVRDIQSERAIAGEVIAEAVLLRLPPDIRTDILIREYVAYEYGDFGDTPPGWMRSTI